MFIYACVASWLALSSLVVPPPATGPAEPSWVDTEPAPPSPGLHARTEVPDDPYLPPATPPRPPEGAPRTPPEGVQVNVDSLGANIPGDAANEPSIAVDPTNPNNIVIGWRQFDNVASNFRQAGYAYSHDAGRHWTFPGVLEPGVFRSDPVLGCDPDGTFFYYSLTLDGSLYTCQTFKSIDKGLTWTGPVQAFGGDKNWMTIDRTGGIGRGNIYVDWNIAYSCCNGDFGRSIDHGQSFDALITMPNAPYWGTITVGPDGEVYVGALSGSSFRCLKSTNAQNPFIVPTFSLSVPVNLGGIIAYGGPPNPDGLLGQCWIDVDRSNGPRRGWVYMLCTVNPPGTDAADVMFARSADGGHTWSAPVRVNDDPPTSLAYQWFGTMSVAPNGRIDAIWNDTRDSGQPTISRLYYSSSVDGGTTWTANTALSPAFDSTIGWPSQNKIGDYYGMISDDVGASVAYAATFNGEQDVWFLRIGDYDCNGNGIPDAQDLASGTSTDLNNNGIPDECDGLGDLNCDGLVNGLDIGAFIMAMLDPTGYGLTYPACNIQRADVNGDGQIDPADVTPFVSLLLP